MSGDWQVIVPDDPSSTTLGTNYAPNPSFERNTNSWTAGASISMARTAGAGVFGAYGLRFTSSNAAGTSGVTLTSALTVGATGTYTASAWVRASSSLVQLRSDLTGTSNHLQTASHPGDGDWHRLQVTVTIGSVAPYDRVAEIRIIDTRTSAWTAVDVDGVQVEESSSISTYIDGDQPGCIWLGAPHNSSSRRLPMTPYGGTTQDLGTANLSVRTFSGTGPPDSDISTNERAFTDGSLFGRQLVPARVFLLQTLVTGSSFADLQDQRRTLWGYLNPDKRDQRGPIMLRYAGADTVKQIGAYVEAGMALDKPFSPRAEMVPLRFRAPDPFWYSEIDSQAALTGYNTVTGVNNFLLQDDRGVWSNMAGGTSAPLAGYPNGFRLGPDGYLYAFGDFTGNLSGVSSPYLGKWDKATRAWVNAFASGAVPNGAVWTIEFRPTGGFYVGGDFTQIGASGRTRVAYADSSGVHGAMSSGANDRVTGLFGNMVNSITATGDFTSIGGVGCTRVGYWSGYGDAGESGSWSTVGSIAEDIVHLQYGPDGLVYGMGSTTLYYSPVWSPLATCAGGQFITIQWRPDGLYAFGSFTSITGGGLTVSAAGAARLRGYTWEAIATSSISGGTPYIAGRFGPDGVFRGITSNYQIDGVTMIWTSSWGNPVRWEGGQWAPDNYMFPSSVTAPSAWPQEDGSLAVGMQVSNGTVAVPYQNTVTNTGSAEAWPVFVFDGPGTPVNIVNRATGKALRFDNIVLFSDERAVLDLRPGVKTFTSNRRQLISHILPGSDLDTFSLVPGGNILDVFATSPGVTVAMFWRRRYWGSDD